MCGLVVMLGLGGRQADAAVVNRSLHTWLTDVLAEPVRDILTSRAARERRIYNVDAILSALQNHHRLEPREALRLFHVAEFELWHGIHRS
jgi:hypothetical protein